MIAASQWTTEIPKTEGWYVMVQRYHYNHKTRFAYIYQSTFNNEPDMRILLSSENFDKSLEVYSKQIKGQDIYWHKIEVPTPPWQQK